MRFIVFYFLAIGEVSQRSAYLEWNSIAIYLSSNVDFLLIYIILFNFLFFYYVISYLLFYVSCSDFYRLKLHSDFGTLLI